MQVGVLLTFFLLAQLSLTKLSEKVCLMAVVDLNIFHLQIERQLCLPTLYTSEPDFLLCYFMHLGSHVKADS
jgi:hypothetical protein